MVLIRKIKSFGMWLFNQPKNNNTEENEDDIELSILYQLLIDFQSNGFVYRKIFYLTKNDFNYFPKISKRYVKFNRCIYYYIEGLKYDVRLFLIHPFYHHTNKDYIGKKYNQKPKTIIPLHIVRWIDDG